MVGDTKLATTPQEYFTSKKKVQNKWVLIHTGGVDAMWRLSKAAIPCSLASRVENKVNPKPKHQGLAMALDERLRSCLGKDRFHVAEAHGPLRLKKVSGRFLTQNIL